jgi:hypothetical protein
MSSRRRSNKWGRWDVRGLLMSLSGEPRRKENCNKYGLCWEFNFGCTTCNQSLYWMGAYKTMLCYTLFIHNLLMICNKDKIFVFIENKIESIIFHMWPPLWSSGQGSWLQTEMYCDSCEVRTEFIYVMQKKVDRLCGLVDRVPGYTTEMY